MSDKEKKELTATQVFSKYMQALDKVRALSATLTEKIALAEALGSELGSRFGIRVSGLAPVETTRPAATAPSNENTDGDGDTPKKYVPPTQYHADAPTVTAPGSAEVAEIRREAGLSEQTADSEALAASGIGTMGALQKGMGGTPAVIATPGEHHDKAAERSNAEGGPVRQGPEE